MNGLLRPAGELHKRTEATTPHGENGRPLFLTPISAVVYPSRSVMTPISAKQRSVYSSVRKKRAEAAEQLRHSRTAKAHEKYT